MQHETSDNSNHAGHESLVLNVRPIAAWLVVLFLLIVSSFLLVQFLMTTLTQEELATEAPQRTPARTLPRTGPLLNPDQTVELQQTRAEAQQWLSEYAWVDQQTGIARIPISRAVAILSQDGLPDVGETTPSGGNP